MRVCIDRWLGKLNSSFNRFENKSVQLVESYQEEGCEEGANEDAEWDQEPSDVEKD
jgi:hypothetical protein